MITWTNPLLAAPARALANPLLNPSPKPSGGTTGNVPTISITGSKTSCIETEGLCRIVFRVTHQKWLAESSDWLLAKPFQILLIMLVAFTVRFLVHRMINRLTRHTAGESAPGKTPGQRPGNPGSGQRPAEIEPPRADSSAQPSGADQTSGATQTDAGQDRSPLLGRMPEALRNASFIPGAVIPTERRRQRAQALGSILRSISSAVIFTIAAMFVLDVLRVNLAPVLASAGIVGLAVGFGAQNLVRDFLSGIFILIEDQFGVGDTVVLGQLGGTVSGTVEAVGLRITTVRDNHGAMWHIRNGEIIRVGNQSQGSALAVVDIPVQLPSVHEATAVLAKAAAELAAEPEWARLLVGPPEVLGVEEVTTETAVLRTTATTDVESRPRLERELRSRLTAALTAAGLIAEQVPAEVDEPSNGA